MSKSVVLAIDKGTWRLFVMVHDGCGDVMEILEEKYKIYMGNLRIVSTYETTVPEVVLEKINNRLIKYRIDENIFEVSDDVISTFVILTDEIVEEIEEKLAKNTCKKCNFHVYDDEKFHDHILSDCQINHQDDIDSASVVSQKASKMDFIGKKNNKLSLHNTGDKKTRKKYQCGRCLKVFRLKGDYSRHKNRKFPCKKHKMLSTSYPPQNMLPWYGVIPTIEQFMENPKNYMSMVRLNVKLEDLPLHCFGCGRTYSRSDSLKRHLQHSKCSETYHKNYMEIFVVNEDCSDSPKQINTYSPKSESDSYISFEPSPNAVENHVKNGDFVVEKLHEQKSQKSMSEQSMEFSENYMDNMLPWYEGCENSMLPECYHNFHVKSQKRTRFSGVDDQHQCRYCGKVYSHRSGLSRHLNGQCEGKRRAIETEELDDKEVQRHEQDLMEKEIIFRELLARMKEQEQEIQDLRNEIKGGHRGDNKMNSDNTMKDNKIQSENKINSENTNTVNIQNNHFELRPFGKEDISHITDEVCKKILDKGFTSVPRLINKIHYEKSVPANHNVYISNLQTRYAMIYDGDDWKITDRTEVINRLYEDKKELLESKFEKMEGQLSQYAIARFRRFLSTKIDSDAVRNIKQDIKEMMYNQRKIPQNTIKKLKIEQKEKEREAKRRQKKDRRTKKNNNMIEA